MSDSNNENSFTTAIRSHPVATASFSEIIRNDQSTDWRIAVYVLAPVCVISLMLFLIALAVFKAIKRNAQRRMANRHVGVSANERIVHLEMGMS